MLFKQLSVRVTLLSLTLLGGVNCAGSPGPTPATKVSPPPPGKTIEEAPGIAAADPRGANRVDEQITLTEDGKIQRAALNHLLDRGPQEFISRLSVRAAFRSGRFIGWRVLSYGGPGRLLPGDVVVKVNGNNMERPEQFMAVWEQLRSRDALVVDVVRKGSPLSFRYPIVD